MQKVKCPYCGKDAEYIDSKDYYSNGVSYGMMYICWGCDARVGVHRNTDKPKGTLAKRELLKLRIECHRLFDPLWKSKKMTRSEAYKYLEENTSVKHIGETTIEEANRVIKFLSISSLDNLEGKDG